MRTRPEIHRRCPAFKLFSTRPRSKNNFRHSQQMASQVGDYHHKFEGGKVVSAVVMPQQAHRELQGKQKKLPTRTAKSDDALTKNIFVAYFSNCPIFCARSHQACNAQSATSDPFNTRLRGVVSILWIHHCGMWRGKLYYTHATGNWGHS